MEHSFWRARWREGRTGFHRDSTNNHLLKHWSSLDLDESARVLVPLCGKSLDMLHLRALGHEVVGVELSAVACEAFFTENGLSYQSEVRGSYSLLRGTGSAHGITLVCGDFFGLERPDIGAFDAFYDRAALIALPTKMRADHIAAITRLMKTGGRGLLTTIDYPHGQKSGPPFAVAASEVTERLSPAFIVTPLDTIDSTEQGQARWALSWLKELQFALTKR